jgi:hypothetical protein
LQFLRLTLAAFPTLSPMRSQTLLHHFFLPLLWSSQYLECVLRNLLLLFSGLLLLHLDFILPRTTLVRVAHHQMATRPSVPLLFFLEAERLIVNFMEERLLSCSKDRILPKS